MQNPKTFSYVYGMCITWEIMTIDLVDKTLKANHCAIIMNIADPAKLDERLFLVANQMIFKDHFIICFHPDKSYHTHKVVAVLMAQVTWKHGHHLRIPVTRM